MRVPKTFACLAVLVLSMAAVTLAQVTDGQFVITASLQSARDSLVATVLDDGRILVSGGSQNNVMTTATEIFSVAGDTAVPSGNLISARAQHTATLLHTGTVLI